MSILQSMDREHHLFLQRMNSNQHELHHIAIMKSVKSSFAHLANVIGQIPIDAVHKTTFHSARHQNPVCVLDYLIRQSLLLLRRTPFLQSLQ